MEVIKDYAKNEMDYYKILDECYKVKGFYMISFSEKAKVFEEKTKEYYSKKVYFNRREKL